MDLDEIIHLLTDWTEMKLGSREEPVWAHDAYSKPHAALQTVQDGRAASYGLGDPVQLDMDLTDRRPGNIVRVDRKDSYQ